MRTGLVWFFAISLGWAAASCSGSPGGNTTMRSTQGAISGRVYEAGDRNDNVGGATIRLSNGMETVANESGWFFFSDIAPADRLVITVEKSGYMQAIEPVTVRAGAISHLEIGALRAGGTATFEVGTGGVVHDNAGARAEFPARSIVGPNGQPLTGDVTVTIAALDPTDRERLQAFPGDFTARRMNGSSTMLETVVPMAIEVRQGNMLGNIAQGMQATVSFPIPAAAVATSPATIELWSLDPATGAWREEGTAMMMDDTAAPSGKIYRATISHLSWWNCDRPITETTCIRGCVRSPEGRPVQFVRIQATGVNYLGESTAVTGEDGCFGVDVKLGSRVSVVASTAGLVSMPQEVTASMTPMNIAGGVAACQDIGNLSLAQPLAQVILVWGQNPSDLDSHFTGPSSGPMRFHVYYGNKGSLAAAPFCALDTDDTSSFGPEITTLTQSTAGGRYRFSVHNFSGQSSGPIEQSMANVLLILPRQGVIRRFQVPAANPMAANVWRVFDLTANASGEFEVTQLDQFAEAGTGYDP